MLNNQELAGYAEKAADIVDEGWCQDEMVDGNGNVCAEGALLTALFGDVQIPMMKLEMVDWPKDKAEAFRVLCAVGQATIAEESPVGYAQALSSWNDRPDRTSYEVSDMWRRAAKDLSNS